LIQGVLHGTSCSVWTQPWETELNAQHIAAARYIGQRVRRKEDPRLLTGRGQFVDDISLPRMLHCAFVRSPVARGKILSFDSTAARELPGVHAIYTADDLARRKLEMLSLFMNPLEVPTGCLAEGRVSHVGDPIALVIADSRAIAEDAASMVEIEIAEEDPVVTMADARSGPPVHPGKEDNIAASVGASPPDQKLASILGEAPHRLTHRVTHQRIVHAPMETRGVVAATNGPEELTIYIACQSPHLVARWFATALGLPDGAIRVIAQDVGGSFGLKSHPWREEAAVVAACLIHGRPLKWIEDRYENLISANQAREQEMTLQLAFDGDGRLLGSFAEGAINNGAFPTVADANVAPIAFLWSAYRMPAFGFLTQGVYTNTVGLAAYRGPWAIETLVRETAFDVAARKMGMDPVELRRRNIIRAADLPMTSPLGIMIDNINPAGCLDKLLETFDVAAFRREQAEARRNGRYLGLGIAAYVEPTASAGSVSVMTGELAQIRIEPTGKVTATMSTHSQGHGTATTIAQIIADRLGVRYEDVTVFEGDSSRGGFSPGAAGSRQAVISGGASLKAAEMLADKVRVLAAHLLNAPAEAIRIEQGLVHVEGVPDMTRSLSEIADIAYGQPGRLPPGFETGLEVQYRYQPPPITFASAAHACVVEVDVETGFVKILRWISSEDCGTVINPAIVEGQISGGLAQAIGMVLLEEMSFDARGNPTAATFKDYLLPAISNVPDFEFVSATTPSHSLGGFRGAGEGGAIIGPPTLINAIADALAPFGDMTFDLPLTPRKILSIVEGREL
jgi:carbon-monoxide dehydrogenase large subunit